MSVNNLINKDLTEARSTQIPVGLFAVAAGVLITNMFAPQTLIGPMSKTLGLSTSVSGLIAMDTSLGYAAGLLLLVPIADLIENRTLSLRLIGIAAICAGLIAFVHYAPLLFVILFALGAASSVIQVLMPLAASSVEPEKRGQVLGDIMSGLMMGILLARPIASFLAGLWGWQSYYVASAAVITTLFVILIRRMPSRQPMVTESYQTLIGSLWHLVSTEPVLSKRSLSAAIVMVAFNLFWTTIAFVLTAAPFHFDQFAIAGFALAGAGGALITPVIGRFADRGYSQNVTKIAHLSLLAGFALAAISVLSSNIAIPVRVGGLALSALLLDVGVLGDQTVGRYLINQLKPEARGRINGIFVGTFFIGGALGSAISSLLWTSGGWSAICVGGALTGLIALLADKTIGKRRSVIGNADQQALLRRLLPDTRAVTQPVKQTES